MIREAVAEDFEHFYQIKSEIDNMYWCGYTSAPKRESLWAFWNRNVPHTPARTIYMVLQEDFVCGYVYADTEVLEGTEKKGIELSIGISERYSNGGLATKAIEEACRMLTETGKDPLIYAYIRTDNLRSQRVFSKAGFVLTENFREMHLENQKEPMKLYQWIYQNGNNSEQGE